MNQLMSTLLTVLGTGQREGEREAHETAEEAIRAAEAHLTCDEFEALWSAIEGIYAASDLDSFTLGFRLGVQLTLEGLRPIVE